MLLMAMARLHACDTYAGEINCNDCKFSCVDAVFQRNHAPGRLGAATRMCLHIHQHIILRGPQRLDPQIRDLGQDL